MSQSMFRAGVGRGAVNKKKLCCSVVAVLGRFINITKMSGRSNRLKNTEPSFLIFELLVGGSIKSLI